MQQNKEEDTNQFQLVEKKKTSGRPHHYQFKKNYNNIQNNNKKHHHHSAPLNHHHDDQKPTPHEKSAINQRQQKASTSARTQQHSELTDSKISSKHPSSSSNSQQNQVISYSAAVISSSSPTAINITSQSSSVATTPTSFYSIPHHHINKRAASTTLLNSNNNNSNKKQQHHPSSSLTTKKPSNSTNNNEQKKEKSNNNKMKTNKSGTQSHHHQRKAKITPQFFIIRKPMIKANDKNSSEIVNTTTTFKPILPNHQLPKEPQDEMGKSFYNVLKTFIEDTTAHTYDFPNTLNLSQRRRVHSLAEQFNLDHFSRGSNPFRYICVCKRGGGSGSSGMNDEFQYFGYIGLFGHSIDQLVRKFTINPDSSLSNNNNSNNNSNSIINNQQLLRKRIKRDGPIHHMTIMTRPEINSAIKNLQFAAADTNSSNHKKNRECDLFTSEQQKQQLLMKSSCSEEENIEILMTIISQLVVDDYKAIGLGRVQQKLSQIAGGGDSMGGSNAAVDDVNESYFVIIDWPSAQRLRSMLGLEPYDFHITVAYKHGDIHGVKKDRSTALDSSTVFEITNELLQQKEIEMSNWLRFIGVDGRYAHSLINLGWFNIESIASIDKMDLSDIGVSEEDQSKILSFVEDFSNNFIKYNKEK